MVPKMLEKSLVTLQDPSAKQLQKQLKEVVLVSRMSG